MNREIISEGLQEQFDELAAYELDRMKRMDAYIAIRGSSNIFEHSDVPPEQMSKFSRALKGVLDWRVKKTKWVVLRWPSPSMAQQALMSTEAFRDFYFRVCTMDYSRMILGMKALRSGWIRLTKSIYLAMKQTFVFLSRVLALYPAVTT